VFEGGVEFPGGMDTLQNLAQQWAAAYKNDARINPVIGSQCGGCEFRTEPEDKLKSGFHECWKNANNWTDKDFTDGTVLDIWNYRGKQKMIAQGVYKLKQVNQEDLNYKDSDDGLSNSQRQWMQVSGIPDENNKGGFYLDSDYMETEMAKWRYPYHFIDFETSSVALPFYKGMRPYEQIAFQFSHHVMNADGSVEHVGEFLMTEPGKFPNYEFAHALKKQLDKDEGTIFMWSHHENTILNRIAIQLQEDDHPPADAEELIAFIQSITKGGDRAMVDLCTLAQKSYFHPDTKGGNSIKKVLPAVLKTSNFLRDKYSQPVYGAEGGVSSLNFKNHVW
jgi:hypothetical protein